MRIAPASWPVRSLDVLVPNESIAFVESQRAIKAGYPLIEIVVAAPHWPSSEARGLQLPPTKVGVFTPEQRLINAALPPSPPRSVYPTALRPPRLDLIEGSEVS